MFIAKKNCVVIVWLLIGCCCKPAAAQDFSMQYFTASQGLPNSEILSLAKDYNGFLWVGSSAGISRYDGYDFKNYQYAADGTLIGQVNCIKEDAQKRLWIGASAGLFCCINNVIKKVSKETNAAQGINNILFLANGNVWLASANGPALVLAEEINVAATASVDISRFILPQWRFNKNLKAEYGVALISEATDGTVFIAGLHWVCSYAENILRLIYFDDNAEQAINIFPVSRDKVYVDKSLTGIHLYENGDHRLVPMQEWYHPGKNTGQWSVGTEGIYCFDRIAGHAGFFYNTLAKGILWPSAVLPDHNFFWLASHQGLIKLTPHVFTTYQLPGTYAEAYSFYETGNGKFLLGSNRGKVFEKTDTGFRYFFPAKKAIVPTALVTAMYEAENKQLLFGTDYQGMVADNDGKLETYTRQKGLHDNSIRQFIKTGNGKLFGVGDYGISEIIIDRQGTMTFKKYPIAASISRYAIFYSGIEGPANTLWIAGQEGIFYLQNDTVFSFLLNGKKIPATDIKKDGDGNVWIGTNGQGLLQCFFENNQLKIRKQFLEKDGLNSLFVLSVLADNNKNTWIGTSRGLSFLNRQNTNASILNFTEANGFLKNGYYTFTMYQDKAGTIWAGTSTGIVSFDPGIAVNNFNKPVIGIDHASLLNTLSTTDSLLDISKPIILSYENNTIQISYTAIDLDNPGGINYFYRMDGLDSNWINAGSLRTAMFQNLKPGSYLFRVKALNDKGAATEKEAGFSFVITAPFWQKSWFVLLILCIVIAVIYLLLRQRINKIKKDEKLQTVYEKRIAEVEMASLRAQMNPHFMFNSLNSINNFILKNDPDNASGYLTKFSRLMRLILDNSRSEWVSMDDELKALELYIQLEALRFDNVFSYAVEVAKDINTATNIVPPMIIQPYVENAIWHGLMHRRTEKNGRLDIRLWRNHEALYIEIEDNGVGRQAATDLKSKSATKQKSHGMKITAERMEMVNRIYNIHAGVEITDLENDAGCAIGTRVTLKMDYKTSKDQ